MAQQVDGAAMPLDTEKVGIKGYLAFFLTIIFFSGVFSGSEGWWRVFDFTVLNGSFGHVTGTQTFRGAGGTGAKDGFLFALELAPSVILSLGIIAITDGLGGLRAAQQLMTPILKPLLGIPGICSLKRRTKNAKAFHDKCENFSFRASNETAVLITAFYSLHGDHLGYG